MTATESLLPEIINDFFNKICHKPTFLVRECSNTGGCIDHGLLTDCDEADIRPVKIEDYEYYPTDQRAHDVDG
jgi:hypothetical protein